MQAPLIAVSVVGPIAWIAAGVPLAAGAVLVGVAATLAFGPIIGVVMTVMALHVVAIPTTLLAGLLVSGTLLPLLLGGHRVQQLPATIAVTTVAFVGGASVVAGGSIVFSDLGILEQGLAILAIAGVVSYGLHRYEVVTVRLSAETTTEEPDT